MALRIVISGAPGTGKTTVGTTLAQELGLPLLSLDVIKEALGDSLGLGDESWSDRLGDAAAEVLFELAPSFPAVVVEGWWRGARRDRAIQRFHGYIEVACRCEPKLAEQRMRERVMQDRHPIHRDVINPSLLDHVAELVSSVKPLSVGAALIEIDTSEGPDLAGLIAAVRTAAHDHFQAS
jgi:predicted kinase